MLSQIVHKMPTNIKLSLFVEWWNEMFERLPNHQKSLSASLIYWNCFVWVKFQSDFFNINIGLILIEQLKGEIEPVLFV